MFTGLVQHVGRLRSSDPTAVGRRLIIDPAGWPHQPAPGDSIAVSGVCLTIVSAGPEGLAFEAIPETLSKTTLGELRPGSRVNLEHAATPTTLLGGHIVQGHVDGVGQVVRVRAGADWRIGIRPVELMEYMIPKGSVCVDGVSLTLAAVDVQVGEFEVALIPVTLEKTTLSDLREGGRVNIEADAMVKAVAHVVRHYTDLTRGKC